jgi:hypothetical protein
LFELKNILIFQNLLIFDEKPKSNFE